MSNEYLSEAVNWIWALPGAIIMYFMKKQSDTVSQLDKDVTKLQAKYVDEDKVRSVVDNALQPLRLDINEIKAGMQTHREQTTVQNETIVAAINDLKLELARREGPRGN